MSSPRPLQEPTHHRRPKRDLLVLLGLMALFVIGFIGLAASIGWEETWAQLRMLSPVQFFGLLALSMINYTLRGLRWHIFSQRLGLPLELRQNILHFMGGFAMTVTPGRIGELVRLRWISRLTGWTFERILPLPFVDRAFDVAAMGIVLACGVVLSQTGTVGAIPVAILAMGTALIVTRPKLILAIVHGLWKLIGRWPRRFVGLRKAARSMAVFSAPTVALPALALSIIGWSAEGYALYLLLTWMGADISLAAATVIFIFSTLAGGLTGAPGGVGGAEAAMLMLLSAQSIPLETALPAMAVIRITTLWFAIFVGLIAFPIAEKLSKKV
ncbi:flippase-like domain-containing protein [Litoreibacter sp.]|nr:flippase-like domain-containing protein [Litoreibacter sp.]